MTRQPKNPAAVAAVMAKWAAAPNTDEGVDGELKAVLLSEGVLTHDEEVFIDWSDSDTGIALVTLEAGTGVTLYVRADGSVSGS